MTEGILLLGIPIVGAITTFLFLLGIRLWLVQPLANATLEQAKEENLLASQAKTKTSLLQRIGAPLAPKLREKLPPNVLLKLQRQIDLAGRPKNVTVNSVLGMYCGMGVTILPLGVIYALSGSWLMALLIVAMVAIIPIMRLATTARKRRESINADLPDFMDVLAVTVNSGVGFRSALNIVASRFGGPLSEELTITLDQIANGASLRGAFSSMRNRTNSESVDEFVSAYLQAEELGTPLAETLKTIATDMRRTSAQRNLQKAHKTTPKITLVSTAILVPAVIILIVAGMFLGMDVDFSGLLG